MIGVWELTGIANGVVQPIPFGAADVTVRYDHAGDILPFYGAGDYDQPERTLVLAQAVQDSGQWIWIPLARAMDNATVHQVSAQAVDFSGSAPIYLAVFQPLPGDISLDGVVNGDDLAMLTYAWLSTPTSSNWWPGADINADGIVNSDDLAILTYYWLWTVQDNCTGGSALQSGESQMLARQAGDRLLPQEDKRTASLYAALEQAGLLDVYLDYLSTHQQAQR